MKRTPVVLVASLVAATSVAAAVVLPAEGTSPPGDAVRFPASFDAAIYVGDAQVYSPAAEEVPTSAPVTSLPESSSTAGETTSTAPLPASTTTTELVTTTVAVTTTTAAPTTTVAASPSGQAMPALTVRPGWDLWRQDFLRPAAEGQFLATYWTGELKYKVNTYPPNPGTGTYNDTSTKNGRTPASIYDPNRLSVTASGLLRGRLGGPLEGGKIKVAAFLPQFYLDDRDVSAVHCVFRAKADVMPSYKVAWLLWPKSNRSNPDGEVDFLEGNLNGSRAGWFMHRQDPTANGVQDYGQGPAAMSAWATYEFEWQRAASFWAKVNGAYVKNQRGENVTTAFVPANEMHPVFQSETRLDRVSGTTAPADSGSIYVDWLTCETRRA